MSKFTHFYIYGTRLIVQQLLMYVCMYQCIGKISNIDILNSVYLADCLCLYCFCCSQITKNRTKGQGAKSPAVHAAKSSSQRKPYKHLCLVPFASLKRIVDIKDSPGSYILYGNMLFKCSLNFTAWCTYKSSFIQLNRLILALI